ncbi:MAG TPA: hypothetical protein PKK06_11380 [Phycisphaerae bacterium]|nr:hypothetical protein [Phycisphaerae bacterium]HNU45842.1 hypothetical protein [Phycisphaerae bacterium]
MRYALRNLLAVLLVGLLIGPALAQDIVEVTVTGEGMTEDEARRDALRKALETGGGVEISSHSQVENFVLIRDTIYARAEGIVTDYKIVEKGPAAGGIYFCKIVAKVDKSVIASTWGAVQNLLDQLGQPRIVIYIRERIDNVLQDGSIFENNLENRLLKAGFAVYAGQQVQAIMDKEAKDAEVEGNVAKMQAIAKDFGAQIFITGTANANAAGVRDLYGEPTAMYNGDGAIKMFYTDTGEMVASESLANWRGGARGFREGSPQAGKKAIENAAEEIGARLFQSVMEKWSTRISAGGEITLEIEGVSMADALKIKQKLSQVPKVERVAGPSLTKGIATFRIVAKMTAEDLAVYLVDGDWPQLMEIVDLKLGRIQAKKPG